MARPALVGLMLVTAVQLLGALLHTGAFNGSPFFTVLYLVNSLAVFLFAYYYNLNTTLLNKSYTLLAVGAVLLVLRPLLSGALENSNKEAVHE